jgi:hypothetical protein
LVLEGLEELLAAQAQGQEEFHLLLEALLDNLSLLREALVVESELLRAIQQEVWREFRAELLGSQEQQEQQEEQRALVEQITMGQALEVLAGGHLQRQHLLAGMEEITPSQG